MARLGKYSSKSTGTSDRKSSGRLSSAGGETGSPIQKFKLGGTTNPTDKLKISHVVLNKRESFECRSEEDLDLLNMF